MLIARLIRRCIRNKALFCKLKQQINKDPEDQRIDKQASWTLARSSQHNHSVSHFKRSFPKDRYSIHKLSDLEYMCLLIIQPSRFQLSLNLNQRIMLLSRIVHVIEVTGKKKTYYEYYINQLLNGIVHQTKHPPDLICIGSFMMTLIALSHFSQNSWYALFQAILLYKFDEDFDQLYGMVVGLQRYKQWVITQNKNYLQISKNEAISKIPIIYRNSLQVLRQFIIQNIYNIKECSLIFQALYDAKINESYFWDSARDWFNIYTKQQLGKKEMQEYFIMNQQAIDKVLHGHGIIMPRPILQELSTIVYFLGKFGSISWRFIQFSQDLVVHAIEHQSQISQKYQKIAEKQAQLFKQDQIRLNQHIQVQSEQQRLNIKNMERKYRTIYINPISLKDRYIIYYLVTLSRAFGYYDQLSGPENKQAKEAETNSSDKKNKVNLDPRVKKWLLAQLIKPEQRYTVSQILEIYCCRRFILEAKSDITELMIQKLQNPRKSNLTYQELCHLLQIIPKKKYHKMSVVIADFLSRNHPSEIFKMTNFLEQKNLFIYLSRYLIGLPMAVNSHQKYYSFQQNCFFMLILLKNQSATHLDSWPTAQRHEYQGQMELIKQGIKIATYNRGFKLAVNSYFHQLLDYIDPVSFFQDGR